MKPIHYTLSVLLLASASLWAENNEGYKFETVVNQKVTPVKDQASTGTCWCFATTSFVEAELLRQGKGEYDLSEMFIVRQKYMNQLKDNFLRQGKGNIGQEALLQAGLRHSIRSALYRKKFIRVLITTQNYITIRKWWSI